MRVLVMVTLGLLLVEPVVSSCLPEAILPSQRINLTNPQGESYPLGIDIGVAPNGVIRGTSAIVSILLEEIYGYNVSDFVFADGPNAAAALAGCSNPAVVIQSPQLAGCDGEEPRLHVALAVILSETVYAPYFKSRAPIRMGAMGYDSTASIYFSKSIGDAALADGYSLSYYQNWNASWHNPAKYFDPISVIPTDELTPCLESHFNTPRVMAQYVAISGDYEGLHPNGTAICVDDYWFIAPACRSNVSLCVPMYVGKQPRPLIQCMQKAAAFSMPFAINQVVQGNPSALTLPWTHKMAYFYMHPRGTTLFPLHPMPIEFPPYDELAWSNGDYRTLFRTRDLTSKYVSWNLEKLAPRVVNLLERLTFPNSLIDTIFEFTDNVSDWRDVGCQWLLSNRDVWQAWIPDETVCLPGFGLYNSNTSQYVSSRPPEAALTCIPCASGRFSEVMFDDRGVTYICSPCPVGTSQSSGAALRCEACPAGEYQDLQEGKACKRCSIGLFQDQPGATACKNCSAETTTVGLGSKSPMECGCKEGCIETERDSLTQVPHCVVCQPGLVCPKFSTKEGLKSGISELGEEFLPQLHEGFMALQESPLSVYKCRSPEECPGGTPGRCAGGRSEIACASCGPEKYLAAVDDFSRMRSKGSRCTLGVWGLRVCSPDVAQPSATVRNRPQPCA
eukprot:s396_g4.t1